MVVVVLLVLDLCSMGEIVWDYWSYLTQRLEGLVGGYYGGSDNSQDLILMLRVERETKETEDACYHHSVYSSDS
uniref:Secreted protein n=1 Tax=Phakopsora pachyrhizi TaxID=170000 RepID=A0A0S1MIH8_PHAPC